MEPIKSTMTLRNFVRNLRQSQIVIKRKKVVLLENKKENTAFVIMPVVVFQKLTSHRPNPTIKEVERFLNSLSGKWQAKINPLQYQRQVREEWDRSA